MPQAIAQNGRLVEFPQFIKTFLSAVFDLLYQFFFARHNNFLSLLLVRFCQEASLYTNNDDGKTKNDFATVQNLLPKIYFTTRFPYQVSGEDSVLGLLNSPAFSTAGSFI